MATPTMITVDGDLAPDLFATDVVFRIPSTVAPRYNSGPDVILPGTTYPAEVAPDGTFTVDVPASNDPNWSPANWTYEVHVTGPNLNWRFDAQVPVDVTPLNFSSILPAQSASLGTLYAAFSHTHEGGGGGSGALPSGSVVAGTAFGAASTAGAATTYSRGDHSHGTPAAPTAASIGASPTGHNHSGTYDPAGTATAAVAAHVAAGDPHSGYALDADLAAGLATKSDTSHNHTGTYQPLDTDLTTIAGLTATTDNMIQSVGGSWASRTPTQVKTALSLNNVANTADADKPVSTATQTALDAKLPLLRVWNGSAYVADADALIFAGPSDPGAVPDGSVWIEV